MTVGQSIIRTRCGDKLSAAAELAQMSIDAFRDTRASKFGATIDSEAGPPRNMHHAKSVSTIELPTMVRRTEEPENPLRGHKFHHDCLR